MDDIQKEFSTIDAALSFTIGCLAVFGLMGWTSYTAYGMAAIPIIMCLKKQNDKDSSGTEVLLTVRNGYRHELKQKLAINKENQRYLTVREKLTANDRIELDELRQEEEQLITRIKPIDTPVQKPDILARCWDQMVFMRIPIGIIFFLISELMVISMLLSVIDKFLHSTCKLSCGYAIDKAYIFNPLDKTLNFLSQMFPLDFILFGGLVTYIFVCSIAGMVMLGIRLCGLKLYRFQKNKTMSHALLMGSWMLMFVCLVLNMQVLTLSPQYATFGAQFYYPIISSQNNTNASTINSFLQNRNSSKIFSKKSKILPTPIPMLSQRSYCTMHQRTLDNRCYMTWISQFINGFQIAQPFFGIPIFYANILFLLTHFLSLMHWIYQLNREPADCPSEKVGLFDIW